MDMPAAYLDPSLAAKIDLISASFERLLGRELVPPQGSPGEALWNADMAIVAHGDESDPVFFYANRSALAVFESSLGQFLGLPSRLSAETADQAERDALFERVKAYGYIDDYRGPRISAKGRRFLISDGIVWNLVDEQGNVHGQAALFKPEG